MYVAKTKALINFAKSRFSHNEAQLPVYRKFTIQAVS